MALRFREISFQKKSHIRIYPQFPKAIPNQKESYRRVTEHSAGGRSPLDLHGLIVSRKQQSPAGSTGIGIGLFGFTHYFRLLILFFILNPIVKHTHLVSSTGEVFITGIGDDFAKNWHKSFSEMPVTYKGYVFIPGLV